MVRVDVIVDWSGHIGGTVAACLGGVVVGFANRTCCFLELNKDRRGDIILSGKVRLLVDRRRRCCCVIKCTMVVGDDS